MSDETEKKPNLDRRSFFRLGAHKAAKTAVDIADKKAKQRAKHFIRPPFAINELDFLLKCTRCNDCLSACPHDTIFPLSARLGVEVMSTPALDLTHKACHLCEGWPCVISCTTQALVLPEIETDTERKETTSAQNISANIVYPKLALAMINPKTCLPFSGPECGACGSVCPVPEAIEWDMTRPQINPAHCIGCGLCRQSCITEPKSIKMMAL